MYQHNLFRLGLRTWLTCGCHQACGGFVESIRFLQGCQCPKRGPLYDKENGRPATYHNIKIGPCWDCRSRLYRHRISGGRFEGSKIRYDPKGDGQTYNPNTICVALHSLDHALQLDHVSAQMRLGRCFESTKPLTPQVPRRCRTGTPGSVDRRPR